MGPSQCCAPTCDGRSISIRSDQMIGLQHDFCDARSTAMLAPSHPDTNVRCTSDSGGWRRETFERSILVVHCTRLHDDRKISLSCFCHAVFTAHALPTHCLRPRCQDAPLFIRRDVRDSGFRCLVVVRMVAFLTAVQVGTHVHTSIEVPQRYDTYRSFVKGVPPFPRSAF